MSPAAVGSRGLGAGGAQRGTRFLSSSSLTHPELTVEGPGPFLPSSRLPLTMWSHLSFSLERCSDGGSYTLSTRSAPLPWFPLQSRAPAIRLSVFLFVSVPGVWGLPALPPTFSLGRLPRRAARGQHVFVEL